MASAPFGDVAMSLFVAGTIFGDVGVSLFVASASFGDVAASLFVAGAIFGEIWVDSRSAKRFVFPAAEGGRVSCANERVQFCTISCSDHARVVHHVTDASCELCWLKS